LTLVGFYIVEDQDPDSPLRLALRLTEKAHRRGHRIFLNCRDEAEARELDERLWSFRSSSFVPHALVSDNPAEQVCIAWGQAPEGHDDLLINLQSEIPPFVDGFRRVAELVNQETQRLQALRKSWRQYRERGYTLEEHRLASV
jgi:DNA polymerase-3 subunit chi